MEEVLREYVRSINVVLRDGKLYMTMYDELYAKMYADVDQAIYRDNILVLLDGVPINELQQDIFIRSSQSEKTGGCSKEVCHGRN